MANDEMRAIVLYLAAAYLCASADAVAPVAGPADLIIKLGSKCDLRLPTMVDYHIRYFSHREKHYIRMNFSLPWPFGDDIGMNANVAVKKSGAWKPNFLQLKTDKLCSMVKIGQYEIFKLFAEQLNAPKPYSCPLPPGSVSMDYSPDMREFQKNTFLDILPYGEMRAYINYTRRNVVVACLQLYANVVPKKKNWKG